MNELLAAIVQPALGIIIDCQPARDLVPFRMQADLLVTRKGLPLELIRRAVSGQRHVDDFKVPIDLASDGCQQSKASRRVHVPSASLTEEKDVYFTLVMTYLLSAWANSKLTVLPTVSLSNTILSLT